MTAFEQDVVALDAGVPVLLASVSEPNAIRVLLIEDGVIDRGFLANELSKQGFAVRKIASLTGAPHAARDADVVVLHCDCAKISSIDLLVNLHRQGVKVPVVLLTGEAPPTDECLALDRGAVDVIRKSRGSDVLIRRLKSVVKASNPTDQPLSLPIKPSGRIGDAGHLEQGWPRLVQSRGRDGREGRPSREQDGYGCDCNSWRRR
jgi:DNA-binding response OmpR family regulator